jgi:cytochrome P450
MEHGEKIFVNTLAQLTRADIPGPALRPLIGWRGLVVDFTRDSAGFLQRLYEQFGPIAQIGQGRMSATFTFHPDYTRQILSNPNLFCSFGLEDIPFPFSDLESLRAITTALSLLNGDLHKQHRRLMAPAFHNSLLPVYVNQISDLVDRFFGHWKIGDEVDVYQAMDLFTLSLAMEIFVGMRADEDGQRFAQLFENVLNGFFSPATILLPYDIPGLPYHRLKLAGAELERSLRDLIHRRREMGLGGTDSLTLFLQAHDVDGTMLTDNEVIGETVAVFRGGSKTSASALAWTIFLLAQHPEILAHLSDELAATLRGASPTFEQLKQLPLLEGVIKESLRLIPPVLWGTRYSTDSFELGPYHLEKGSTVIYSSHVTHRMPEIYKEPYKFNPYRWREIKPSPYEYFPFNAGPRRCLGAEFAMLELKITLAMLLQRYRFALLPGQRIDRVGLTGSVPKRGIKVKLERLDGNFVKVPVKGNIHRLVDLK